MLLEKFLEMADIVMMEDMKRGTRQLRTCPQTGMAERIGKDRVAAPHKTGHNAGIGEVPRTEDAGLVRVLQVRQAPLKDGVKRVVSSHQSRGTRPHPVAIYGVLGRSFEPGMYAEAKIIIA